MEQAAIRITDQTHVSEARRAAIRQAQSLSFTPKLEGNLAIVVTELARNVLTHGGGGEILLQPSSDQSAEQIDVFALDKGPGIADLARCLTDGFSSSGTPGTGLGAVARLASSMDVYSRPGAGTAIMARIGTGNGHNAADSQSIGAVCVPIPGETRCGDAWACRDWDEKRMIMVADGLGHGPSAAEASDEAIQAFSSNSDKSPKEILEAAHARLQKTRGAAVAVAEINFERQIVRYSGIGNIAGGILANGNSRSLISHNGIVGHQAERYQEFTLPWEHDAFLIMHSDGVNTRWNLDRYPGLQNKPESLIAAVLYRDFKRGRDDATVVVTRERRRQ